MKQTDEHGDDAGGKPHAFRGTLEGTPDGDCSLCGRPDRDPVHAYAALADLKRTVNAPAVEKGAAEPILGPGWALQPAWATFRLDSFEADDGTVDRPAARQWLRENGLAAWRESFVQAPCRAKMANDEGGDR